jgi:hypothetical protein
MMWNAPSRLSDYLVEPDVGLLSRTRVGLKHRGLNHVARELVRRILSRTSRIETDCRMGATCSNSLDHLVEPEWD